MRVVFDTNILVLYLLGGTARAILEAAFSDVPEQPLSFFYSPAMMDEYTTVLNELPEDDPTVFYPENTATLLQSIERHGHLVRPTIILTGDPNACSHEPDNRFLECAVTAQADYIVTVNIKHFPASYRGIETILPYQCYDILFAD